MKKFILTDLKILTTKVVLCCLLGGNTAWAVEKTQTARNFFDCKFTGSRIDFTGNVGYEFTTEAAFTVTALGRSISGEALRGSHTVTIWSVAGHRELARVVVTPKSTIDALGFAYEALPQAIKLESGCTYRITSSEEKGSDAMMDIGRIAAHIGVATVQSGVYVPAKDAASVTESGKAIDKTEAPALSNVEGVKFLRMENGCAVYEAGSGQYSFGSSL
jgi:hypothetical protein